MLLIAFLAFSISYFVVIFKRNRESSDSIKESLLTDQRRDQDQTESETEA